MRGIGERLSAPVPLYQALPAVLVNPGVALPTKAVFAGWKASPGAPAQLNEPALGELAGARELIQRLAEQTNDLEPPAMALQPSIAAVLAMLRETPGCVLARPHVGLGRNLFGLFGTPDEALAAEKALSVGHPKWWVKATTFGG